MVLKNCDSVCVMDDGVPLVRVRVGIRRKEKVEVQIHQWRQQ